MRDVSDILNITSDFYYTDTEGNCILLTGSLVYQDNNIVLECRIVSEQAKLLGNRNIILYGDVGTTKVTLTDGCITFKYKWESDFIFATITPSEIIIGRKYVGKIKVKKISSNMQALNRMFSNNPLYLNHNFSRENPSLVEFTYQNAIKATDKDGEIFVYQTIAMGWFKDKVELPIVPIVDYLFNEPTELKTAVAKIASARNLFAFFADYHIPLENITFSDEDSKMMELCDCTLYMNYKEEVDTSDRPFIILTNKFEGDFEIIWRNWSEFYDESKYIPALFYEIICNRSTRINRFLNLAQAIEIYSIYYREKEVKIIAKKDGCNKKFIPLKYRMEDIISHLNYCFEFDKATVSKLSKSLSDSRNFFTHYNNEKYLEPSFQEMLSAGRLLRFVLLSIIYKTIGISDECIKECGKYFSHGSLKRDINITLKKENNY